MPKPPSNTNSTRLVPKGDPASRAGSSIEIIRADRGAVSDAEGGTVNASPRLVDL